MIPAPLIHAAIDLARDQPDVLARIHATLLAQDDARAATLTAPDALARAAAAYVAAGVAVFPLVPGEKRPIVKRGLHEATTDPAQVAAWWAKWPQANIGLRTGLAFDVIDVDGPSGYLSLAGLREQGLIPDQLGRVHTARGGAHLYVAPTGDGNAAGLCPGIDYRGAGGYVVAPPSLSAANGRRWTWVDEVDFTVLELVAAA